MVVKREKSIGNVTGRPDAQARTLCSMLFALCFLFAEQVKRWRCGSWELRSCGRGWRRAGILRPGFRNLRLLPLHKFPGIEQRAPPRCVIAGPRSFEFRLALKVSTHRLHLGIQI